MWLNDRSRIHPNGVNCWSTRYRAKPKEIRFLEMVRK
jgi:hypothetical protein